VRRVGVARIEEAEVVEPETNVARQLRPRAGVPARRLGEADVGIRGGDPLHHLPPAQRLLAIGREKGKGKIRKKREKVRGRAKTEKEDSAR
jgi:hypothetical protein